jgi:uncharacterized SAM-binding protein YcdF (DUF218 family)
MSELRGDSIITLSAGFTPEEELDTKSIQRLDTGIDALKRGVAPNFTVTGAHSFMLRKVPTKPYAAAMKKYAIQEGIPEGVITYEDKSLDTVAQAIFTKVDLAIPNAWEHLIVVTSMSHLARSKRIFEHVYGKDFEISGIEAPENVTLRERIYEPLASVLLKEVLRGTKPGDHEAVQERLFDLIPGYSEDSGASIPRLAVQSLTGLLKTA